MLLMNLGWKEIVAGSEIFLPVSSRKGCGEKKSEAALFCQMISFFFQVCAAPWDASSATM